MSSPALPRSLPAAKRVAAMTSSSFVGFAHVPVGNPVPTFPEHALDIGRMTQKMSELERWESRFAAPGYHFGTAPNAFLKSQAHRLRAGQKALALADGEGRNGVWLAEQGLDVLSLDFSPNALKKARALAARDGQPCGSSWPTFHNGTGQLPRSTSSWRSSSNSPILRSGRKSSPGSSVR